LNPLKTRDNLVDELLKHLSIRYAQGISRPEDRFGNSIVIGTFSFIVPAAGMHGLSPRF